MAKNNEDAEQTREVVYTDKKGINWTIVAVGGAIIGVSAVGIYYLYSRQQTLDKLQEAIIDYQQEYDDFMQDGVLSASEEEQLKWKQENWITPLVREIEQKGLIEQATEMLWTIGYIITVWYVGRIIYIIIQDYIKRHPPSGGTQAEPFVNPLNGTKWPTPEELVDDAWEQFGMPDPTNPELDAIWSDIQQLPEWVLTLLYGIMPTVNVDPAVWLKGIEDGLGSLSTEQQWMLAVGLIAAAILCICFYPPASAALGSAASGIIARLLAISQPIPA